MLSTSRCSLFTTLLVALACSCTDEPPPEPKADQRTVFVAALERASADGFSGAVLITVGEEQLIADAYGLANRERDIANTPATVFDMGSIMKDMTAAAVFKLQERGALDVKDAISSLLEGVPLDKRDITILQLLQHRSGLGEYHDVGGDFEVMTRDEARQRILDQPLLFAPGTNQAYSNSGFTLLADIVESASGQTFTDYVSTELFSVAGMVDSGFPGIGTWSAGRTAIGYGGAVFGENDPAKWPYTWALVGNGGLVSTVFDLERWVVALWKGEVLGSEAFASYRDDYLSPGALDGHESPVYIYAGGGDYGHGGALVDVPDIGTRVVVATNAAEDYDFEGLAEDLALLALNRPGVR